MGGGRYRNYWTAASGSDAAREGVVGSHPVGCYRVPGEMRAGHRAEANHDRAIGAYPPDQTLSTVPCAYATFLEVGPLPGTR